MIKIHRIQFRLGSLRPCWESLRRSPRSPSRLGVGPLPQRLQRSILAPRSTVGGPPTSFCTIFKLWSQTIMSLIFVMPVITANRSKNK